jgi:hypothetical protein
MSDKNDQWGFGDALPWVLVIGGCLLMPAVWPLGAVLLGAGVAMILSALKK